MRERQLTQLSNLYGLLASMEAQLGLVDLTEDEKKILYALTELSPEGSDVASNSVKAHEYCSDISSPTFYRALKRLTERDFIAVAEGRKAGLYHLTKRSASQQNSQDVGAVQHAIEAPH